MGHPSVSHLSSQLWHVWLRWRRKRGSYCLQRSSLLLLSITATHPLSWCVRFPPPALMPLYSNTLANGNSYKTSNLEKGKHFIYVLGVHGCLKDRKSYIYLHIMFAITDLSFKLYFKIIVLYFDDLVYKWTPPVVIQLGWLRPHSWWMEMFKAHWVTRCIRGQHSRGVTNWIMTHEGQIWARDLASKVTLGSRSVLHSRPVILSLMSGTLAFTVQHIHPHMNKNTHLQNMLCQKQTYALASKSSPILFSLSRESVDFTGPLMQCSDLPLNHPPSTGAIEFFFLLLILAGM